METILITGGAGFVGVPLTTALLKAGHKVTVYDLFLFGDKQLFKHLDRELEDNLTLIKGDIRNIAALEKCMKGIDHIIHLACISNDPSFELNPKLGKEINYDCLPSILQRSRDNGIKRFIYASSSSVYGLSTEPEVHEDIALRPITDYAKYKALGEKTVLSYATDAFCPTIIRPATVCGVSPRQRLDVVVNILTHHAFINKKILIFGGEQLRPNIHMDDMVQAYLLLLNAPEHKIRNQAFNAGEENRSVKEIAEIIHKVASSDLSDEILLEVFPSDDKRSYHLNSNKIKEVLGWRKSKGIEDASRDLLKKLAIGHLPESMDSSDYFNIKKLKEINLS